MSARLQFALFAGEYECLGGVVLAVAVLAAGCSPLHWTDLSPDKGGFEIEMPGRPVVGTEILELSVGVFEMNHYTVLIGRNLLDPHVALYSVAFAHVPSGVSHSDALAGIERSLLNSLSLTEIKRSTITVDGYDAVEVTATTSNDACARARFLIVNDRVIQIVTDGDCDAVYSSEFGGRFLDSLRVASVGSVPQ